METIISISPIVQAMRSIVLEEGEVKVRDDYPLPEPTAKEALVRVTLAGICSTDLEILRGYVPGFKGVMGHEFCGVVEKTDNSQWIGKRVCSRINIIDRDNEDPIHRCCIAEHHPQRTVLGIIHKDGCFAEFVLVPIENLIEIPKGVTNESAVFTEPLAAALRIRDQIRVRPTERIAVVGAGKLGMLVAKVVQSAGNDVEVLTRSKTSMALPLKWGLHAAIAVDQPDDHYDCVVEATGNIDGFRQSLRLVRPMGTIVLKSTFAGTASIDLTKVVVGEITIVGSRCGPFPAAMRILERGEIKVNDLIDGVYDLADAILAFEKAKERGIRKILIRP